MRTKKAIEEAIKKYDALLQKSNNRVATLEYSNIILALKWVLEQ